MPNKEWNQLVINLPLCDEADDRPTKIWWLNARGPKAENNLKKTVFCFKNCLDLLWEKIVLVIEKTFEIRGWRPIIWKFWIYNFVRNIFQKNLKKKWYFVTKIVLTHREKKLFKKTFVIRGLRPKICKKFEITRTICSISERSEQFLVTECFLTCSWRFLTSNKLEQL